MAVKAIPGTNQKTDGQKRIGQVLALASKVWSWIFLVLLILFFSTTSSGFFSARNFQNIGIAATQNLVLALGATFVIITGGIDLSVGFTTGLAAVVSALIMQGMYTAQISPILAIITGIIGGIIVSSFAGFINGVIISKLKVPAFIVTLGMYGIARGIALTLTGGPPVSGLPPEIGALGNNYLLYYGPNTGVTFFNPPPTSADIASSVLGIFPHSITITLVIVIICHIVLSKTLFGQHTYAIGGNEEGSRRAGINVDLHLMKIYALSGLMAGIAGALYVARFTSGSANAGEPLLLDSIAAVVIGGASLSGGEGTILGTVIGALIIAVLKTGFILQGINPFWQFVAVGTVIILAVLMDQTGVKFRRS